MTCPNNRSSATPSKASFSYIPELDGLRAIAAFSVVAFHADVPGFLGGFLGVDIFFVLSGYLTTSLALANINRFDTTSLRQFMTRRLRRLWPLLICVGLVYLPVIALRGHSVPRELAPSIFFFANLSTTTSDYPSFLIHTWTLGTEMQFYLLLALLVMITPNTRHLRMTVATMYIVITAVRMYYSATDQWQQGFYSPISHSSGLFVGAFLSTLPPLRNPLRGPLFLISALAVIISLSLARFITNAALFGWIPLIEIAAAGLITSVVGGQLKLARPLRVAWLRRLGVLSYGIYLWHYPINVMLEEHAPIWLTFGLTSVASIILSAISYRYVESRFWKKPDVQSE